MFSAIAFSTQLADAATPSSGDEDVSALVENDVELYADILTSALDQLYDAQEDLDSQHVLRYRIAQLIQSTERQLEELPSPAEPQRRRAFAPPAYRTSAPRQDPAWPSTHSTIRSAPLYGDERACRAGTSLQVGSDYFGDHLTSSQAKVCLVGLGGHDVLELQSGAHDSDALGGPGDDQIAVDPGNQGSFLAADLGADVIYASDQDDVIYGQDGSDQIYGYLGHDYVHGGAGPDYLLGMDGDDEIFGAAGDDTVFGGSGRDRIMGDEGNDYLVGDCSGCVDDDDVIYGGSGDDVIWAGGGNDVIDAGPGHDHVYGQAGDDEIRGGRGPDYIWGDSGRDTIYSGGGADQIYAGSDDDTIVLTSACSIAAGARIDGGPGHDTLVTPLTLSELNARGVYVSGVEEIEISHDKLCGLGTCEAQTQDGHLCECPANWEGLYCRECAPGYHFARDGVHAKQLSELLGVRGSDFELLDADLSGVECVPDESCADIDCGDHGVCQETSTGEALCACDLGWGGDNCDICASPWEADGDQCVLGRSCDEDMCNDHGGCVADPRQRSFACVCDEGYSGVSCRVGDPRLEVSKFNGGLGEVIDVDFLDPPLGCPGSVQWRIIEGEGATLNRISEYEAELILPDDLGDVDLETYTIEAQDGECDPVRTYVSAYTPEVASVTGQPHRDFIEIDRLIVNHRVRTNAPGYTFAMTNRGKTVYMRAYGLAEKEGENPERPMRPSTRIRLSSITKPITRAAIRTLETEGSVDTSAPVLSQFRSDDELEKQLGVAPDGEFRGKASIRTHVSRDEHIWKLKAKDPSDELKEDWSDYVEGRLDECLADPGKIDPLWISATVTDQISHNNGTSRELWRELAGMYKRISDYTRPETPPPFGTSSLTRFAVRTCLMYPPGDAASMKPYGLTDTYSSSAYAILGSIVGAQADDPTISIEDRYLDYLKENIFDGMDEFHLVNTPKHLRHPTEPVYYDRNPTTGTSYIEGYCCPESDPEFPDCKDATGKDRDSCIDGVWVFDKQLPTVDGRPFENRAGSGGLAGTACGVANVATRYDVDGRLFGPGNPFSGGLHYGANDGNSGYVNWLPRRAADSASSRGDVTYALVANYPLRSYSDDDINLTNLKSAIDAVINSKTTKWNKEPIDNCYFPEVCGNGIVENDELCDDGNRSDSDCCSSTCQPINTGCGDGIVCGDNQCDDGNMNDDDGCSAECIIECGNGELDGSEECDDGNQVDGDWCSSDCKLESTCGDGLQEGPFEECDDGNFEDGDGCSANCEDECGNGRLDGDEECDDGNRDDGDFCSSDCQIESTCGDGINEGPFENCDDGNLNDNDGCSSECQVESAWCGNGQIDTGEVCDQGNFGGQTCANFGFPGGQLACINLCTEISTALCTTTVCGNGVVEGPEQCDDGNTVSGDGCSSTCQLENLCGNGVLDGGEACDDGNHVDGDGCSSSCQFESSCGNGVREGAEECDDGNRVSQDGCSSNCKIETAWCGNGVIDAGEVCDGRNFGGEDCESQGSWAGALECIMNCTEISTEGCRNDCDGGGEPCDE